MLNFDQKLKDFARISREYSSQVLESKKQGKKVVCWYGSYVPPEIIHAAGVTQYPLFDGGDAGPAETALQYMLYTTNVQARYQVGQHILGLNPITRVADLIVVDSKEADSVRVGSVFEYLGLPVKYLGVPQDWEKEIAFEYYKRSLQKLKSHLEKLSGENITDEKLIDSIKKYNQLRDLLSQIGSLRKKHPPPIGGDFIKLNHYALRCKVDDAIKNLRDVLGMLNSGETRIFQKDVVRIMVVGRGFAFGDYLLLDVIEESGGVVVSELLDEGIMHPIKVRVDGDPIENIAKSYYRDKVPSVFFSPSFRKRWEYTSEKINEFHVDGLIYYNLAFDCIYDHEMPIFAKWAGESNISFLMIESAYSFSREAMATLRSRVEAFIEMCRGSRVK